MSAVAAAQTPPCVGDCGSNHSVSVPDLIEAVEIALGVLPELDCPQADPENDGVTIDNLVLAVDEHLNGCEFAVPTATPTPVPPDLVPMSVQLIAPPPPGNCVGSLSDIPTPSVNVCVRNAGAGDSPAFQVLFNGTTRINFDALPAGEVECESAPYIPFQVTVVVDPDNLIPESDESNNQQTFTVPVLTPPLTCSPTPTPTHLPPGTPSDTPAPSATPTNSATSTASASPTATATPTPTRTPALPDLIPDRIVVVAPTPEGGCIHDVNELMVSMLACVLNAGDGDAGPFVANLTVAGTIPIQFPGAGADSEVCEEAPFIGGSVVFDVDPQNQILESNESNNSAVFSLVRPTLPPLCATPTPG